MLRCKLCVMPASRPDTPFVDGICGACINYTNRPLIDWNERLEALFELLGRFDGRCLVPSSGGKDSTFQVLKLRELGADVTTVTAMTCMPTEIGLANIENLKRYAPAIIVEPDRRVRPILNRLGLTLVGDISWPEHASIFTVPFRVAAETGNHLLFYGENPQNQYGGPMGSEQAQRMTVRWRSEFGGFLGLRPADLIGKDGLTSDDLVPYTMPSPEPMDGIEAHFLGAYLPWDGKENAKVANAAGMRQILPTPANWWISENQDNAQTGIHDYFGYLKYGYGRGCAQVSMDIRAGRVPRERAMEWVREYDGLLPYKYMGIAIEEVLEYIGMTGEKFSAIADQFTNWDLFQKDAPYSHRVLLKDFGA